jgi:hypothetical protein
MYIAEKALSYKMEMGVDTMRKRKYEVLEETEVIDEVPTDRDIISENSTLGDNNEEVEEDAKRTSCLKHASLRHKQLLRPARDSLKPHRLLFSY